MLLRIENQQRRLTSGDERSPTYLWWWSWSTIHFVVSTSLLNCEGEWSSQCSHFLSVDECRLLVGVDCLKGWLIGWLTGWKTGWMADWLTDRLIDAGVCLWCWCRWKAQPLLSVSVTQKSTIVKLNSTSNYCWGRRTIMMIISSCWTLLLFSSTAVTLIGLMVVAILPTFDGDDDQRFTFVLLLSLWESESKRYCHQSHFLRVTACRPIVKVFTFWWWCWSMVHIRCVSVTIEEWALPVPSSS